MPPGRPAPQRERPCGKPTLYRPGGTRGLVVGAKKTCRGGLVLRALGAAMRRGAARPVDPAWPSLRVPAAGLGLTARVRVAGNVSLAGT